MALRCNKCERIVRDDRARFPCPNEICGARDWMWVNVPADPYELTVNDRRFLKSLRIESAEG